MRALIVALLLGSTIAAAHAQTVFRCVEDRTGKISYSNVPCHGSNSGREISVRENSLDTSGAREQALRRELSELRSRVQTMEQESASAAPVADRRDSEECRQARRSYDIEAGSMTRNKSTVEAKRSAMYGACGMREPDRVEITNRIEVTEETQRRGGRPAPTRECFDQRDWNCVRR